MLRMLNYYLMLSLFLHPSFPFFLPLPTSFSFFNPYSPSAVLSLFLSPPPYSYLLPSFSLPFPSSTLTLLLPCLSSLPSYLPSSFSPYPLPFFNTYPPSALLFLHFPLSSLLILSSLPPLSFFNPYPLLLCFSSLPPFLPQLPSTTSSVYSKLIMN